MGWGGISWTICKSLARRFRQITTPVPHHSVTILCENCALQWEYESVQWWMRSLLTLQLHNVKRLLQGSRVMLIKVWAAQRIPTAILGFWDHREPAQCDQCRSFRNLAVDDERLRLVHDVPSLGPVHCIALTATTVLGGWQEGHPACPKICAACLQRCCSETSRGRNLMGNLLSQSTGWREGGAKSH